MSTDRKQPLAPAPDSPAAITAAADEEIATAEDAVTALEDAVRAGDETITLEAVEDARKRLSWAKLRRAAADVKAARLADEQAKAAAQAVVAAHYETACEDIDAKVRELLDQVREPIAEALTTVTRKNAAIFALARDLDGNPQPDNPVVYFDGRPMSAWVEGPDGRRHGFTPGQRVVAQAIDSIVRSL